MVLVTWLVVSSLVAGTAARQARPDFTGEWVLLESADVPAEVPGEIDINESGKPPVVVLTVKRRWLTEERTSIYTVGVTSGIVSGIGGRDPGGRGKEPSALAFSAASWKGSTLVLEEAWQRRRRRP